MTTVTEGIREKAERLWRRRSGASWLEMQEKSAQHSGGLGAIERCGCCWNFRRHHCHSCMHARGTCSGPRNMFATCVHSRALGSKGAAVKCGSNVTCKTLAPCSSARFQTRALLSTFCCVSPLLLARTRASGTPGAKAANGKRPST